MLMSKKISVIFYTSVSLFLPLFALADVAIPAPPARGSIPNLWALMVSILQIIWPIFIGVSIFMFLISGFLFLTARGEPNRLQLARSSLIWGIVGVIVGILAFSIPFLISDLLNAG